MGAREPVRLAGARVAGYPSSRIFLIFALLLLLVSPLVSADDADSVGGHHHHGNSGTDPESITESAIPPSYFLAGGRSDLMAIHIASGVVGWVVALPASVLLGTAGSRIARLPIAIFIGLNGLCVITGFKYNRATDDMYTGSAHPVLAYSVTAVATVWALLSVVGTSARRHGRATDHNRSGSVDTTVGEQDGASISRRFGNGLYQSIDGDSEPAGPIPSHYLMSSPSASSSQASARLSLPSHQRPSLDLSEKSENGGGDTTHNRSRNTTARRPGWWRETRSKVRVKMVGWLARRMLDWTVLPLGFSVLCSGGVVYMGVFRGRDVYGGLAHFVKGAIFFWYGLFTLARWMGSFASLGWAWNRRPTSRPVNGSSASTTWVPTASWVESFLLFLYGTSNVFLEHLGGAGDAWTAQDYEHLSIAILFLGGGLLGLIVESGSIRAWFGDGKSAAGSETLSTNPVPALMILLLGVLMSSHHQSSPTSTTVHSQWGILFVAAAISRLVTVLIVHVHPPVSELPSRPPTELVTSFCLVAGGLVFMLSTHSVIRLVDQSGAGPMFVFTVTAGLSAIVMAWEAVVIGLRAWALSRRESRGAVVMAGLGRGGMIF